MVFDTIINFSAFQSMPKAIPQVYFKQAFADEAIPEITVLSRPAADPEGPHG